MINLPQKALPEFEKVVLDPHAHEAHRNSSLTYSALAFFDLGLFHAGLESVEQALAINQDSFVAWRYSLSLSLSLSSLSLLSLSLSLTHTHTPIVVYIGVDY